MRQLRCGYCQYRMIQRAIMSLTKFVMQPTLHLHRLCGFKEIQVSQKWRTKDALRCRRDYRKGQKSVKKILLDLFANLAVFESGT
jgi:hypothetical protein